MCDHINTTNIMIIYFHYFTIYIIIAFTGIIQVSVVLFIYFHKRSVELLQPFIFCLKQRTTLKFSIYGTTTAAVLAQENEGLNMLKSVVAICLLFALQLFSPGCLPSFCCFAPCKKSIQEILRIGQ